MDAWRRRRRGLDVSGRVGRWAYLLLRAQLGLVYFFAGFAKLNADWLLSAEPLRTWLPVHADAPLIGPSSPSLGRLRDELRGRRVRSLRRAALVLPEDAPLGLLTAATFHVAVWLLFLSASSPG